MQSYPIYCAICGAANESDQEDCFACQSALAVPSPSAEPEPLLHGRYRLQRQLGVVGFGAVYQARDELKPDVPIVIKQINLRDLTARQIIEATETFQRERVILSALNHPRLPRLHETFEDQEHWYLVLSYFPGETLEQYLLSQNWQHGTSEPERSRVEELLHCGLQLCEVLSYLHTRLPVMIFRDLKPGNIIRGPDGSYALIDFGIARTVKAGQLRDTIPLGSPGYAAPEQYGRAQTDERADIYSLGAILHQMATISLSQSIGRCGSGISRTAQ
ncbi:MAG TPA: serine/threonine-protein kinase [Ktedonobacteraceae bacterium]|nr:serine/threonine-protein kinase [Ktedonobacteraceae bacterium]